MSNDQPPVGMTLVWAEDDDLPVFAGNQFAILGTDGEIFLTVGQVVPPIAVGGSPEERREHIEKLGTMIIRPVARFSMAPQRVRELHALLGGVLDQLDDEGDAK